MSACDFCGRALAPGAGFLVEVRLTLWVEAERPKLDSRVARRRTCKPECAWNHVDGIDAGVLHSRRALEAVMSRELEEAKRKASGAATELAVAKRGAVRYAARMVRTGIMFCEVLREHAQGQPDAALRGAVTGALGEAARRIENFAKTLDRLPAPQARYESEWDGARKELVARTGTESH
jgi:hypothetical protein